jgi:hypothetical protein
VNSCNLSPGRTLRLRSKFKQASLSVLRYWWLIAPY